MFGWILTAALTVRDRIKHHTFDLIMRTRFESSFLESSRTYSKLYKKIEIVDKAEARRIWDSKAPDDIEKKQAIAMLLNFYEILSISVYFKDADENILKEYFYDLIRGTYSRLQNFIPLWREATPLPDSDAFIYLEWLYKRWTKPGIMARLRQRFKRSD